MMSGRRSSGGRTGRVCKLTEDAHRRHVIGCRGKFGDSQRIGFVIVLRLGKAVKQKGGLHYLKVPEMGARN